MLAGRSDPTRIIRCGRILLYSQLKSLFIFIFHVGVCTLYDFPNMLTRFFWMYHAQLTPRYIITRIYNKHTHAHIVYAHTFQKKKNIYDAGRFSFDGDL